MGRNGTSPIASAGNGSATNGSGRIRLLKFVNAFSIGGTEKQFVDLSIRLDPHLFDLHVACLRRWGPLVDRVEKLGVPILEYPTNSLYRFDALWERLRFARYLRRHRIELVHAYSFYPNLFALPAARAAGVPLVMVSIRDTGAYLNSLRMRVQRSICSMADCIVVNAEAVRTWLVAQGYPQGKIHVIRNGVEVPRFANRPPTGKLQQELGLPREGPLVTVLSHLRPAKGLDSFLEAAADVAARVPDVRFLLVGDGFQVKEGKILRKPYREQLERAARERGLDGRVVFAGYRTDVQEILAETTVSVLPSLTEGLSNSLLESMAAGRPVVATRVGGTPEVVEDGVTGLLVEPQDPGALARAILLLLQKPELAAELGRAGQRRVREQFSMGRMVRDTEHLYLEMLSKRTRHGSLVREGSRDDAIRSQRT